MEKHHRHDGYRTHPVKGVDPLADCSAHLLPPQTFYTCRLDLGPRSRSITTRSLDTTAGSTHRHESKKLSHVPIDRSGTSAFLPPGQPPIGARSRAG